MTSERILDLRSIFGVLAEVTTPSAASDGEYVEMVCTADPGSGTMVHYHPRQEETFHVLEGTMEVLRDGAWMSIQPGHTHLVPRGEVHAWRKSRKLSHPVQKRPPSSARLSGPHGESGPAGAGGEGPRHKGLAVPDQHVVSAVRYRPDVTVKPPQWVVDAMAFIGRRLGFTLEA